MQPGANPLNTVICYKKTSQTGWTDAIYRASIELYSCLLKSKTEDRPRMRAGSLMISSIEHCIENLALNER
jgi:hypothetical protein